MRMVQYLSTAMQVTTDDVVAGIGPATRFPLPIAAACDQLRGWAATSASRPGLRLVAGERGVAVWLDGGPGRWQLRQYESENSAEIAALHAAVAGVSIASESES